MFVDFFVTSLRDTARASRPQALALVGAAWLARLHVFVSSAAGRAPLAVCAAGARPQGPRQFALHFMRRAAQWAARAALRTARAGSPLTPTGYAVLALTLVAVALVAVLSTSSAADELEHAIRLSWWFA
jgi:hypothetical protein